MGIARLKYLGLAVTLAAGCGGAVASRAQTLATIVPAAAVVPERIAPDRPAPDRLAPGAPDGVAVVPPADPANPGAVRPDPGKPDPGKPDPVREAAVQVLTTHCARCHQADRLEGRPKPAKGFGNILDLDALAATAKYVKPGDPDKSPLVLVIVRHEMPSDVFQDGDIEHPIPEDKDVAALRGWIVGLDKVTRPIEVASLPHAGEQLPAIKETRAPPPTDPVRAAVDATTHPDRDPATPEVAAAPPAAPTPAGPAAPLPGAPAKETPAKDVVALAEPGHPDTEATRLLVSSAQGQLRRLGCYGGEPTGVVDAATAAAIARYNGLRGRGMQATSITADLLEEMQSENGAICLSRLPEAPAATPDGDAERPAERPAKREKHEAKPPAVRPPSRIAHEPAERKAGPPPRKIAREPQMRQPSYRQAERRPAFRQAQGRPSYAGQGGAGGSTAQSTVSGLSGI